MTEAVAEHMGQAAWMPEFKLGAIWNPIFVGDDPDELLTVARSIAALGG